MPHLNVHGSTVEYLDQGSGETVLLLHSSGGSGAQWRVLTEQLGTRYRVLAPDLYGYGGTPAWSGYGVFTLAREAALVQAFLERIAGPVHVVGHSYGGAVALRVARAEQLASLTLIEPVAFHLLREAEDAVDWAALREIIAVATAITDALGAGDDDAGCERFVDYWGGAGAWTRLPMLRRDALALRLPKVALDFQATLNDPTRLDDLRTLGVPTLLVQGEHTRAPTRQICRRLAETLPDARLKVVAGADHMLPITHRDEVNGLVTAHLDSHADHPRRMSCTPLPTSLSNPQQTPALMRSA
jgi:pimeloyl-ACP methyl ester carboxylesterase